MNNTLANGLALLELLSTTAEHFSVTELAQRLDVPKSHAHRLLQTLVASGYAMQDEDRRYRIGLQPLVVSSALLANHPLRRAALPLLHQLAQRTGLDAMLMVPHRDQAGLIIATAYPRGRQSDPATHIGNRLRYPATATGLLFACCLPGFADPGQLPARRRRRIEREGFAIKDSDHEQSSNGMARIVRDADGEVLGAVGCSGPQPAFHRQLDRNQAELAAVVDQLESDLQRPQSA